MENATSRSCDFQGFRLIPVLVLPARYSNRVSTRFPSLNEDFPSLGVRSESMSGDFSVDSRSRLELRERQTLPGRFSIRGILARIQYHIVLNRIGESLNRGRLTNTSCPDKSFNPANETNTLPLEANATLTFSGAASSEIFENVFRFRLVLSSPPVRVSKTTTPLGGPSERSFEAVSLRRYRLFALRPIRVLSIIYSRLSVGNSTVCHSRNFSSGLSSRRVK
jgi:hypothetical protein